MVSQQKPPFKEGPWVSIARSKLRTSCFHLMAKPVWANTMIVQDCRSPFRRRVHNFVPPKDHASVSIRFETKLAAALPDNVVACSRSGSFLGRTGPAVKAAVNHRSILQKPWLHDCGKRGFSVDGLVSTGLVAGSLNINQACYMCHFGNLAYVFLHIGRLCPVRALRHDYP